MLSKSQQTAVYIMDAYICANSDDLLSINGYALLTTLVKCRPIVVIYTTKKCERPTFI